MQLVWRLMGDICAIQLNFNQFYMKYNSILCNYLKFQNLGNQDKYYLASIAINYIL